MQSIISFILTFEYDTNLNIKFWYYFFKINNPILEVLL